MATTRACGSRLVGVALELDAFLEIDEVKLDLLRAAPEREVGDDDVEQRGFAGTGLAGDERVLARALADGEILQLGRAGAADGDAQFVRGFPRPDLLRLRARPARTALRRGWNPCCSRRPCDRARRRDPAAGGASNTSVAARLRLAAGRE